MTVNLSVVKAYGQVPQEKAVKKQVVMYTCAMHPEVVQDKPGNCPKCDAKLVEKKKDPAMVAPKTHEPVMEKKATDVKDTTSVKTAPKL